MGGFEDLSIYHGQLYSLVAKLRNKVKILKKDIHVFYFLIDYFNIIESSLYFVIKRMLIRYDLCNWLR